MKLVLALLLDVTADSPLPDLELEVTVVGRGGEVHRYLLEYKRGQEFGRVSYGEREDQIHRNQIQSAIRYFRARGLLKLRPAAPSSMSLRFKYGGKTVEGNSDPQLVSETRSFLAGAIRW